MMGGGILGSPGQLETGECSSSAAQNSGPGNMSFVSLSLSLHPLPLTCLIVQGILLAIKILLCSPRLRQARLHA